MLLQVNQIFVPGIIVVDDECERELLCTIIMSDLDSFAKGVNILGGYHHGTSKLYWQRSQITNCLMLFLSAIISRHFTPFLPISSFHRYINISEATIDQHPA